MRTFGIERERFIRNPHGKVSPAIGVVLPRVQQYARECGVPESLFSCELFAGQIEDRTPPCSTREAVRTALLVNDDLLARAAQDCGLVLDNSEFITEEEIDALAVNPFNERHQAIWASIPHQRRIAASQVAAVHVHIAVSEQEAVRALNCCRAETIDHLAALGDHSGSKRIKAYCAMAQTDGVPPQFASFSAVMEYITSKGGERNVWDLVRFKPSTGTLEFRMFGATSDVEEILGYIEACHDIVRA